MRSLIVILCFLPVCLFAQRKKNVDHFIFDLNVGFKSMMYTGASTMNMTAVQESGGVRYMMYQEEDWELDYDFNASTNVNLGLGINIIQKASFQTKLIGSYFRGKYTSSHAAVRTSHNGVLTSDAPTMYSSEFIANTSSGSVNHQGNEWGFSVALINQFRVFNNLWIGPVLGFNRLIRTDDYPFNVSGYVAESDYSFTSFVSTNQLYFGIGITQKIDRFSFHLNLSQSVVTVDSQKGLEYLPGLEQAPASMNIDFRMPTILEAGVSMSFFRQKNGCGTCPTW